MENKILAMILAVVLALTSSGVSVLAEENGQQTAVEETAGLTEELDSEEADILEDETAPEDKGGEHVKSEYDAEGFKAVFTLAASWEGGYNAQIRLENTSDKAIENWKLEMVYDGSISSAWNADVADSGNGKYIIKNKGWNQDIAVNSFVEFGLSGQENFKNFPTAYKLLGEKTETGKNGYAVACKIDSDWDVGYTGKITITNNTDDVIEDWILEFDGENEITDIWDGVIESHEGKHYAVKNAGYNQNIDARGSVSFGFKVDSGSSQKEFSGFVLSEYTEKKKEPEREKEPLESIGEAYCKEPEESDIAMDSETGIQYVKNQLLISAYMGAEKSVFEEIAADMGAEIVGYIELTNDYQIEFQEEKSLEEIQIIADYIDSFSFVSCVTLNVVSERGTQATTDDALYNDGATCMVAGKDKTGKDSSRPDTWDESAPAGDNWGLEALHVLSAWDKKESFSPVKVGVYDSHFSEHEDLIYDDIVNNPAGEISRHGTHVAGIIAAQHNNGIGISGVATDVRLYAYAWMGTTFESAMESKIAYATLIGNHVKVINESGGNNNPIPYAASHGGTKEQNEFQKKAKNAVQASADILEEYLNKLVIAGYDFVIVNSAGNLEDTKFIPDNSEAYGYRVMEEKDNAEEACSGGVDAYYNNALSAIKDENLKKRIIVVGAISHFEWSNSASYRYAGFSNTGERVDVSAPGKDILSTVSASAEPSGYLLQDGTSMAAPYITGIVALMFQVNPSLKASKVKEYIQRSSSQSVKDSFGHAYRIPDAAVCCNYAAQDSSDDGNDCTLPTGILCGCTKNFTGKSVEGVKITAVRKSTGEYNLDNYTFTFETDTDGHYMQALPQGIYDLIFYKSGYLPYAEHNVVIDPDQTIYLENCILGIWVSTNYTDMAVHGKVTDALKGTNIPGADIKLRKGWNSTSGAYVKTLIGNERTTTTDSDGTFRLNANIGAYTVEISKNGYVTGYYNVVAGDVGVFSVQDITTMVLTPVLSDDEYRIILTWGDSPRDLDSHLTYYLNNQQQFHVFYSQKTAVYKGKTVATLDLDDVSSYGPETITMTLDSGLVENGGVFRYSVHNYSGSFYSDSGEMSLSNATVRVYAGNNLIKTFHIPRDKTGTVWHVFDIDKEGIKPVNTFYNSSTPTGVH